MRLQRSLVVVVAAAAFMANGCQSQAADPVLASVGPRKITLSTYRAAFQALGPAAQPDTARAEWQVKLLGDMVNKDLLELEALRVHPTLDEAQARRLHRYAEGQLATLLARTEVNDKIGVTDADVDAVLPRLAQEVRGRHILVQTEEEARQVAAALKAGALFDTLATTKSLDWDSAKRGGDVGWVRPLAMVESFDNGLFSLKPGELSAPVQTRFGWHIIRCDSVRAVEPPPAAEGRERIRNALMQQRGMARQEVFTKGLMEEAKPENVASTLTLLDKKFYFELPADKQNDPYAKLNAERTIPAFTAEELELPVIKFADRAPMTVKEFNEALTWMPPGVWPSGQGAEELEEALKQVLRAKLTREKAIKLGLDKSPEYVSLIKKKENEIRVNSLYYNDIQAKVVLSETDERNYFESHRKNFVILERALLSRMESTDSAAVARAAADWKAGKSHEAIEAALKKADPAAKSTAETVDAQFMTPRGSEPDLDAVVYAPTTNVGDVVGPVWVVQPPAQNSPGGARWVVAKVLDRQPERFMSFEESAQFVKQQAKAAAGDEALRKALEGMKERFPVKINEKAVKAIALKDLLEAPAAKS